jgi:hypothetical protein
VAAGDIACASATVGADTCHQAATANLVSAIDPVAVLVLGDNQYESGALEDYRSFFAPTWGRFFDRTWPTPGNHEYMTPDAEGYFAYVWSRVPGPYYSFELGGWHLISLNSEVDTVEGGQQDLWLERDLAGTDAPCTLAFWHRPRFSSGRKHGGYRSVQPLWADLAEGGADVVLSGHEHQYERFAPLDTDGHVDRGAGVQEFVVGTGGASLYEFGEPIEGSEAREDRQFGVLVLALRSDAYDWSFVAEDETVLDSGSNHCR